jgi:hypothetical protein
MEISINSLTKQDVFVYDGNLYCFLEEILRIDDDSLNDGKINDVLVRKIGHYDGNCFKYKMKYVSTVIPANTLVTLVKKIGNKNST